ncbi:MAG: hypothetical protein JWM90_1478 [Thermoleophilia bacterium]|nr:hypothetical protein [Thermoleophilia bacterium]
MDTALRDSTAKMAPRIRERGMDTALGDSTETYGSNL